MGQIGLDSQAGQQAGPSEPLAEIGITVGPCGDPAPRGAECFQLPSFLLSALSVSTCAPTNHFYNLPFKLK